VLSVAVVLTSCVASAQDHVAQGRKAGGDDGNGTLDHGYSACQHRLILLGVVGADDCKS
jgi:hypothetical protein